jgi:hypothetical protein
MSGTSSVPRASLAALSLVHALVLGACAYFLPWPALTVFAVLAGATAAGHVATFVLAAVGSRHRAGAWRLTSLLSLGLLAYMTYAALGSGLYVNLLYEGVGAAIFAASIAAWCVAVLFLLPLSLWGLARTGGLLRRKRGRVDAPGSTVAMIGLVVLAFALATQAGAARGRAIETRSVSDLDALVSKELASLPALPASSELPPSLFAPAPVACDASPADHSGATVFVTYLVAIPRPESPPSDAKDPKKVPPPPPAAPRVVCFQRADLEGALRAARVELERSQVMGDALVDVVTTLRPLPDAGPLLGPVVVRPGYEGVCEAASCLLPWQLFGLDAFTEAANISELQAEIGVTAKGLRRLLGHEVGKDESPSDMDFRGLDAIKTRTYLIRAAGRSVTPMLHLRTGPRPLDPKNVEGALKDATSFIISSQVKDGRFRYTVQPFDGKVSFENFSVPRQAGTTLSLCDSAAYHPKAKEAARASLKFLAGLVQDSGELGGVVFPKGKKGVEASLGNNALTLVALLACRPLLGDELDGAIVRLGKTLLAMQRDDGGFSPAFQPGAGEVVPGRDPLYAAGQAVFALVMWEGKEGEGLARPSELGAAIDRAMKYYAGPYWDIPLRDFFYLEENWHCLAARAALDHHRHDGYERFCTDYMTMKMRFIQSPSSGVDEDHVGAYAFGHVFPPHHAASAGFTEGLAASIAIKRARGEPTDEEEKVARWCLSYLMRHQWRDDNCFFCTRKLRIPGGFSENAASPIIRIDFVQHALAGMLHASRALGLAPS